MKATELIEKAYAAFVARDRAGFAALLAPDFAFTSPYDDQIDAAEYFERCWPNGERFRNFQIEQLAGDGDEAFVRYSIELRSGKKFHNTEFFRVEKGRIKSVEVYFGAESGGGDDEKKIRQVIEERERAVREKDAAALVALYAKDAIQFGLAPPLKAVGIKEDYVRGWLDSFDGAIEYAITDLRVTAGDNVAFATSLNRIAGRKAEGKANEMWVRETLALRKIEGAWKITHEHTSVPFYMDGSFRAAVDLGPEK